MEYTGTIEKYIDALSDEIHYLKENGGKRYRVYNGRKLADERGDYIYIIECENEIHLSEGFPIRIHWQGEKYQGQIVAIEEFFIWFAVTKDLGDLIDKAVITCEPWNLLVALNKRLSECKLGMRSGLSHMLIEEGPEKYIPGNIYAIHKGQKNAKRHAQENPITVIWGPPGTGKTYTLSQIAINFMEQGKRVLIVSHSNVSVDGAINKILDLLENKVNGEFYICNGTVLRYGYVRDKKLSMHPTATSYNYTLNANPELKEEKEKLDDIFADIKEKKDEGINSKLREERQKLIAQIKSEEKKHISNAQIVATTASKIAVEKLFYEEQQFDTVIFDEASMSYVPQIIYASSLAKNHFICLGDFRQLAAIAQGKSKDALTKDIFSFLNINGSGNKLNYHPWMVMLNVQRRMHPKIAEFANLEVYDGLIDSSEMEGNYNIEQIGKLAPFASKLLTLVNLSKTYNVCGKTPDGSRFNIMSAAVTVLLAIEANRENDVSVGIITPYTAQARLIRALLKEHLDSSLKISCATVHQFQGSERDIILFDAVESYPGERAGVIMSNTDSKNDVRLINVALTRAKGKFISIANYDFWARQSSGRRGILLDLLKYQQNYGYEIADKKLQDHLSMNKKGSLRCYTEQTAIDPYMKDLEKAKHKVTLIMPEGKLNLTEFKVELNQLLKNGVSFMIKTEKSSIIPESLRDITHNSENAIYPITIIDDRLVWYGFPYWKGEFSVGNRIIPTQTEYLFRMSGVDVAELISSFIEEQVIAEKGSRQSIKTIEELKDNGLKTFIESEYNCADCGAPLTLKKTRKYHLRCTKCRHTEMITQRQVEIYLYKKRYTCPEHGSSVIAKKTRYGICAWCYHDHFIDLGKL